MSCASLVVVVVFCSSVVRAEPAPGVTFTRVADTNTVIPEGKWAGEKFNGFGIPGIDRGSVVFLAVPASSSGTDNAVFKWNNGALGVVADPSTPHPTGGTLNRFREPMVDGDEYAFRTEAQGSGIFRTVDGSVIRVGPLPVTRVRSPSLDGEMVWFYGYSFDPHPLGGVIDGGVYCARGGTIERVVAHGEPTPSAAPGYSFYFINADHRIAEDKGQVVFWAPSSGPDGGRISGLYRYHDGVVTRIVDSTMAAPAGGVFNAFTTYTGFDHDRGSVVFEDRTGVYTERDGVFHLIAMDGQPAPGGGLFSFSTDADVSIDSGHVAFSSGWNSIGLPFAIYSDIAGPLQRIVGRDDQLFGETIARLQLGPGGLSGNQLVFYAEFMNGNSGIFIATIPEPASAMLAGLGPLVGLIGAPRRFRGTRCG
jgi:hypothetical protein